MKNFTLSFVLSLTTIICYSQNSVPCAPPCYKTIENTGENGRFYEIKRLSPDQFLVAGRINNQPTLITLNNDLELISSRHFNTIGSDDFIRKILVDSDGMCLMTTRDINIGETESTILKIDPVSGEVFWSNRIPTPSYFNIDRLLEISEGGNYLASGIVNPDGNCNSLLAEFDRTTGEMLWSNSYDVGNCEFFEDMVITDNAIFGCGFHRFGGIDKIRLGISKFNLQGDLIWSKHYLKSASESSRMYITGIEATTDEIVVSTRGVLSGDNLTNSVGGFMRLDLDGNPILGTYYQTPLGPYVAFGDIGLVEEGFILSGVYIDESDHETNVLITRINDQGEVIWAKKIGGSKAESTNSLDITDDAIYFSGNTKEGNSEGDGLIVSLPLDGSSNTRNCEYIQEVELISTSFGNDIFQATSNMTQQSESYNLISYTSTSDEIHLEENMLCGENITTTDEEGNESDWIVYPNPSDGEFLIKNHKNIAATYKIFSTNGILVKEGSLTDKLFLHHLPSAIYFLRITDTQGELLFSQKLILQKINTP